MAGRKPVSFDEYFRKRVDKRGPDECWPWLAGLTPKGYGRMYPKFRVKLQAHRFAFERAFNVSVPSDISVCHSCDNPRCVNPAHLWLGTNAENTADRDAKGRGNQPRGEKQGHAKLCEADVIAIRASSESTIVLGKRYGVHPSAIGYVRNRKNWRHVA